MIDESNGYDDIADIYIGGRGRAINGIGAAVARAWARTFGPGSIVLDLGCGTGIPVTNILLEAGLTAYAVDASPRMVADFRSHFPDVPVALEAVERSRFFDRTFDGIISVGLMFLLPAASQRALIPKMAAALNPGGSSPLRGCRLERSSMMRGRTIISAGWRLYKSGPRQPLPVAPRFNARLQFTEYILRHSLHCTFHIFRDTVHLFPIGISIPFWCFI